MHLETAGDWLAWAGVVVSLFALACSGVFYILIQRAIQRQRDFDNFYVTLERVHNVNGVAIAQRAAVYELRHFPRYREYVLRLCDQAEENFPEGNNSFEEMHRNFLMDEFKFTARHLQSRQAG